MSDLPSWWFHDTKHSSKHWFSKANERKMSQTPPSFAEELNLHNDSSERERKKVVTLKQVCTTAFLLFLRLLRTRKCSLHKIRRYVPHRWKAPFVRTDLASPLVISQNYSLPCKPKRQNRVIRVCPASKFFRLNLTALETYELIDWLIQSFFNNVLFCLYFS